MNRNPLGLVLLLGAVVLTARPAAANAVLDWNAIAADAAVAACIAPANDPLHESRMYAMMHLAIHDALNAIDRRSTPYAFDTSAPGASPDAAVAAAGHDVLVAAISALPFPLSCVEDGIASVEADYAAALGTIPDGSGKTLGIELGRAAASTVLALRTGDGADTPLVDTSYVDGTEPGEYRRTPGFDFVFAPGWGDVTPFALTNAGQFGARPPHNLRSRKYAADLNEVQALGGDGITTPTLRTPEQTETGLFWLESSPLQWNRIARTAAASAGLDLWEAARLFGLLNMAMADGYIGSWHTKFRYRFWRPVTAIHLADTDGNRDTVGDPTWTPLQLTYPMPDHDSAHSVEGGAAAQVLAQFFGRDDFAFSACSLSLPAGSQCGDASPIVRHYTSFSEAAEENAVSRIYVGIHFRHATEVGLEHGRKIGRLTVNRFLRPTQ